MHTAPSAHTEPPREVKPTTDGPHCPVCNGLLVPLRGSFRCARCFFTVCVGCEAGDAGADGGDS